MWHISETAMKKTGVSLPLRRRARDPKFFRGSPGEEFPVVVVCASEVLAHKWAPPTEFSGLDTRYFVVADVPEPAVLRVVSELQLRRPDLRLHISRDGSAVHRLIVAQLRDHPFEGIVDAYILLNSLVVVLGDFSIREFPIRQIPGLNELEPEALSAFDIDEDGSFLFWPRADLHYGASQLLQALDPTYLADIEIQRFATSAVVGGLLAEKREQLGLRQADIPDLSERQVRRIEQGVSRLTIESAEKFAAAFHCSLRDLLDHLSRGVAERPKYNTASSPEDSECAHQ